MLLATFSLTDQSTCFYVTIFWGMFKTSQSFGKCKLRIESGKSTPDFSNLPQVLLQYLALMIVPTILIHYIFFGNFLLWPKMSSYNYCSYQANCKETPMNSLVSQDFLEIFQDMSTKRFQLYMQYYKQTAIKFIGNKKHRTSNTTFPSSQSFKFLVGETMPRKQMGA